MVARRRLAGSPSSETDCGENNNNNMAVVDLPRRIPLHVGAPVMHSDDSEMGHFPQHEQHNDYRHDNNHNRLHREEWDVPSRNGSTSSSSSSLSGGGSPPRITEVIQLPHHNSNSVPCIESQTTRNSSSEHRRRRESSFSQSSAYSHSSGLSSIPSPFMIGLVLIGLLATFLSRSSVSFAVQKASELSRTRDNLSHKLYQTESDLQSLKREMMAMNALIQQQQVVDSNASPSEASRQLAVNELNALQTRIKDLNSKGSTLKDRVQEISRNEIETKYGGAKYVEMELIFLDGSDGPTKFVIELAAEEMPHSVHTFLEMTSAGLLDGCSFILNALHVLKAAPLPYDGSLASGKAKAFAAHGLESVAFREYNPDVPHEKYTVGFAADGSPSFYINTEDNTDIHVGDPCFGRIVEGLDTVRRLESAPTRNGIWFAKKIGIVRAKVLPVDYAPRHGLRQRGNSED